VFRKAPVDYFAGNRRLAFDCDGRSDRANHDVHYQGRLQDTGTPASGSYDLQFVRTGISVIKYNTGASVLILDLLNIRASQYFNLLTLFHCEKCVVILFI
jgi:hypothetical protein